MNEKTHKSALVIIPSESTQKPIQQLRERYDKQAQRWMPHINLLYPFRPVLEFGAAEERISHLLSGIKPFDITLAEVKMFAHKDGTHTLWLAPEPVGPLVSLQRKLQKLFRDCDDTARQHGGYTPHLSIGQVYGKGRAKKVLAELSEQWQPLSFPLERLSLIARGEPPVDTFRAVKQVYLGREPVKKAAHKPSAARGTMEPRGERGRSSYGDRRPRSSEREHGSSEGRGTDREERRDSRWGGERDAPRSGERHRSNASRDSAVRSDAGRRPRQPGNRRRD